MDIRRLGPEGAETILLQMIDDHDAEFIEDEYRMICDACPGMIISMTTVRCDSWNDDLSPWPAEAVFGKDGFGGGADRTLESLMDEVLPSCEGRQILIGGYSLAGLFALWAVYKTDAFAGAACASPSVWFPGFTELMEAGKPAARAVYLSLGDKEEKTKNPVMATVGDRIRKAEQILKGQGVNCTLEWNQGNHFKDPDKRTANAFAWLIRNLQKEGSS